MITCRDDGRVHFSNAKEMARSPAHYLYSCQSAPEEPTRHMLIGSVTDALVFGTQRVMWVDARRGSKDWLAFEKEHSHALICNATEYVEAKSAADAIKADTTARQLLAGCEFQTVVQWEANGVPCATGLHDKRGGVDAIHREKRYLVDLKSTRSAEPEEFSRQGFRMHWHAQIAWNIDGCIAAGIPIEKGYLLGVESSAPYCVTVLEVTSNILEIGRKEIRLWMERIKSCDAAGVWPGYVQSCVPMTVPGWMDDVEEAA